ncbi:uncharacterized protein RBU33_029029 [Hipposideros larvatus]
MLTCSIKKGVGQKGTSSPCLPGTSRVPKHKPVPNLLFAWDREAFAWKSRAAFSVPAWPRLSFRPRPPQDCGHRASSRPAAPTSHLPPAPAPRRLRASNAGGHRATVAAQRPRPATRTAAARVSAEAQPARRPPLTRSPGRQRRRLHCGSSRASERKHRPPPPAPFQPRTPALPARRAAFHPPQRGRRSPHRAPPPAAAAPAAMARLAERALCACAAPGFARVRGSGDGGGTGGLAGSATSGFGPAGAGAVTGRRCGLPRRPRTPPSAPPLPLAAAAAAAAEAAGRACPDAGPRGRGAGRGRPPPAVESVGHRGGGAGE